jgi:acyl-CoA hydrolase
MKSPPSLSKSASDRVTAAQAAAAIHNWATAGEGRVFIQGGPGEPLALQHAWRNNPQYTEGLEITGLFLPGINHFDYTTLSPTTRVRLFLATPEFADAIATGRAALVATHYSQAFRHIETTAFDVAVVTVSSPDIDGRCSLGLCADAAPAAIKNARRLVGLINPNMPHIANAPYIKMSKFDLVLKCDEALPTFSAESSAASGPIGEHVAALVRDGDAIQIGIGRLPSTILAALKSHRGLRCHGGLIAPGHIALADAGALAEDEGAITGGIALGDQAFYQRVATDKRVRLAPIADTHGIQTLASIKNFVAINAALEIDLFGQVNAEWAGSRAIASIGGLGDFVRGAQASPGGRAIIMLNASGKDATSRIVARLATPCVTLARADADIFLTEFGVANVRGLDMQARAHAIAAIAAPEHREHLLMQWRSL